MMPRSWLLLVEGNQGQAHELTLDPPFGVPVAGPDDLNVRALRLNDLPLNGSPSPSEAARAGLRALYDTLRAWPGWVPRRLPMLSFRTPHSVNLVGRSAELPMALLTYLAELAAASAVLPTLLPTVCPPFAATGAIDELGWVLPVECVDRKVEAALSQLPSGGAIFVPVGSAIPTWLVDKARTQGITLHPVRRLHEALHLLGAPVAGWWKGSPYRALEPYRVRHHPIFFGRHAETLAFCEALLDFERGIDSCDDSRPGMLVEAASGAGKSSFVQAGVLARLRQMTPPEDRPLQYAVWQPRLALQGGAGLGEAAIADSVAQSWQQEDEPDATGFEGLKSSFARGCPATLAELADAFDTFFDPTARYVWVVDQLEEIFSLPFTEACRLEFAMFLRRLQRRGVWIIATMRAEFSPQLIDLRDAQGRAPLAEMFQLRKWQLAPLSPAALGDAIRGPARVAGIRFEQKSSSEVDEPLDQILCAAAARAGAAPLVGYAMHELWLDASVDGDVAVDASAVSLLTYDGYRRIGGSLGEAGLDGVLGKVADKAFLELDSVARAELPRLLEALCAPAPEGTKQPDTSRPAPISNWKPDTPGGRLVQRLKAAGLLTYDEESSGRPIQVRIAHELLLDHWNEARQYLAASRQDRVVVERLRSRQQHWAAAPDRPADLLLTSAADLEGAARVRGQVARREDLNDVLEYIDLSLEQAAAIRHERLATLAEEAARLARDTRRRRRFTQVLASLVVILTGSLVLAGWQWHQAQTERDAAAHATALMAISGQLERQARGEAERSETIAREAAASAAHSAEVALAARRHAELRTQDAVRAQLTAVRERDRSLELQARAIVAAAAQDVVRGDSMTAIATVLALVDESKAKPLSTEVQGVLMQAVRQNRERAVLLGHFRGATSVAFSPDGMHLVTTPYIGSALLWNLTAGTPKAFELQDTLVLMDQASFSPDGTRVAIASSGNTVKVWDLRATPPTLQALEGHQKRVRCVAFSPDGTRLVSGSEDGTARLWDLQGGNSVSLELTGHKSWLNSVAFSPDGRYIATASIDGTARLWDLEHKPPTSELLSGHRGSIRHAAFSPDGKYLVTASSDKTARLWRLQGERPTWVVLAGHEADVTHAAFSHDGKQVVTTSNDKTARLWDLRGAVPSSVVLDGHRGDVLHASFSPTGRHLVTASRDASAKLWSLEGPRPVSVGLEGHQASVNQAVFSPDGNRIATSSWDGSVRLWDVSVAERGEIVLAGHRGWVTGADFSRDGMRLLTRSTDGTARIWDLDARPPNFVVFGERERGRTRVSGAVMSPDGKRLAVTSRRTVVLLDLDSEQQQSAVLQGHERDVDGLAFSPDGRNLVTYSGLDKSMRLWDLRKQTPSGMVLYQGQRDWPRRAIFSPNGRQLATVFTGFAMLWDMEADRPTGVTLPGTLGLVNDVAFSPDSRRLVVTSDGVTQVWDVSGDLSAPVVLSSIRGGTGGVAFSPDGQRFATNSPYNQALLWSLSSGVPNALALEGHSGEVTSIAFSPNGDQIVTASRDTTAMLWTLTGDTPTSVLLTGHQGEVSHAVFSPDGRQIATTSRDGTARLWSVPLAADLLKSARAMQTRCLSDAQRMSRGLPAKDRRDRSELHLPPC